MREIVSPLDGFGSPFGTRRRLKFSPATLFAAGEQGVWFEPSPTTCFTDTAGTTPAQVGQAVALMLDKSRGLELGPELVTNGTFDTDTNWTKGTGWTISGGIASATTTGSVADLTSTAFPVTVGKTYLIEADVVVSAGSVLIRQFNPSVATLFSTSSGRLSLKVLATTSLIQVSARANTNTIATLDNFSCKELPGNHATQSITSARPILRQAGTGEFYLEFDGIDDSMSTPSIDFTGTDKMSVFAGVRKLSDAVIGVVALTDGAGREGISLFAPRLTSLNYGFRVRTSASNIFDANVGTSFPAPRTSVLTGIGDTTETATLRVDGVQRSQTTITDPKDFTPSPVFMGSNAGGSNAFNGQIYSLIVRGALTDTPTIERTEKYVANRTAGVTL
jgi:hypothetical protein